MNPSTPLAYARLHRARFIGELKEFLRIPSVSAERRRAGDVARCANWLAEHLRRIGLPNARVVPTEGHPVVRADWQRPGRPTVLIYGHYDVVGPGECEAWSSPPFEPTVQGDNLYARGACDDKGQLFIHVKALEAFLRTRGALPVNVRCVFEGEEEIGSPNLAAFLAHHRNALRSDAALMSDTRFLAPGRPAIIRGLRGRLGLEVQVQRAGHRDLHSGQFGGAAPDPARALCSILAGLHDRAGRIAIPGFYNRVRELAPAERALAAINSLNDTEFLRSAGLEPGGEGSGERGWSLNERATVRPVLTINGLTAGPQGAGAKGVIPNRATARLEFRLVPDQEPAELLPLIRRHLVRLMPLGLRLRVRILGGIARPYLAQPGEPIFRAAAFAYRKAFRAAPVFTRSGGTIPVAQLLRAQLGLSTVLMGFGLPDDRIHGPDEKFSLLQFRQGIEASLWFLAAAARLLPAALPP